MSKFVPPKNNNQIRLLQSGRMVSLDVLKCFAIFMVLWGHGIQHLSTADCVGNPVFRWIYSFHMPLFMMISGYFSGKSMQLVFGNFLGRKLKQIALPGFVWPRVIFLIEVLFFEWSIQFDTNITHYIPYWFLWALLICNLLGYVGNKFKYGIWVTLLVSQAVPFVNVIYMYPSFVVGQAIGKSKESYRMRIKTILMISAAIYLIALMFWGQNDWHLFDQTMEVINKDGYLKAGTFYVGKTAYKLLVNLSGSVMFFSLFTILERHWNNGIGRFLGFIGKYTLIVYILQSYILEVQLPMYLNLDALSFPLFNFVATPVIAIFVLLFSVAVAALVDKNKYTRLLLLGR